jgi:hypothetical protein
MSEAEPGSTYWRLVEPIWDTVSIYHGPETFLHAFHQVPVHAGHLFAAHWLHSEVCNGGFHQFFLNPTGVLAPEAQAACTALGLSEVATLVGRAMAFFGTAYPRTQDVRVRALEAIPGKTEQEWNPFCSLDAEFYKLLPAAEATFERAADAYAEKFGA